MNLNWIYLGCIGLFCAWCIGWLGVGSWHCFPNAEDLSLSVEAIEKGFLGSIVGLLSTYDGRYFTNALHALNPLVWKWSFGYQLMPVLGLLLGVVSLWFLLCSLSNDVSWRWRSLLLAVLYYMVHLALTPSLPHDLYWMVSSFVYMWPWTFFFGFVGSLLRYLRASEGAVRNGWFILSAFFLICGLGINEMFLSVYALLLALLTIYGRWKRPHLFYATLPLSIIGLACITFFVTCPGISFRLADQDVVRDTSHVFAVATVSFQHLATFLCSLLFQNVLMVPWAIMASLALPAPFLKQLAQIRWQIASVWIGGGIVSLLIMTWSYYWPMGADHIAPFRIQTCLLYGIQLWLWASVAWLTAQGLHSTIWKDGLKYVLPIQVLLASILLVGILCAPTNISDLRKEFEDGTLTRYRALVLERHRLLTTVSPSQGWCVVVLLDIPQLPRTVFTSPQIYPNRNPEYWNVAYERYYGIDEVRLAGDTITKLQLIFSDEFK